MFTITLRSVKRLRRAGRTENEFRYVGEQWDPNAGFYYLRARWMDPSTGRFVSVDPFGGDPQAPVSLHRYLYANASPIIMQTLKVNSTIREEMAAIGMSNILAVNVIPTTFMKKTYSLIIFMTDYYSKELQKVVLFPSEYYLPVLTFIENGFEEENKKGKAKFKLINSIGMK